MVWRSFGQQRTAVEAARQCAKDGKSGEPWYTYVTDCSRCHFCLALCSFGPPSRAQVVIYRLERCGMQVYDAVGKNCENGATTENQPRCQVYGLRGVCWWLCVRYLAWDDYPALVEGESHGILYYYVYLNDIRRLVTDNCFKYCMRKVIKKLTHCNYCRSVSWLEQVNEFRMLYYEPSIAYFYLHSAI